MATVTIQVELSAEELFNLNAVTGGNSPAGIRSLNELVEYLLGHVADGVRRPGSWERGWMEQAGLWSRWGD